MTSPADIVGFWREAGAKKWFDKDHAFDWELRSRFEAAHLAAARGEFDGWASTAEGALALLLLLDQVPRNIYRDTAHAYATDPIAARIAQAAIDAGYDRSTEPALRLFFYLPLEHAEGASLQARAVALVDALGDADKSKWARIHRDIIARFGRFPHRNAALGRISTLEETEFLADGGFKG